VRIAAGKRMKLVKPKAPRYWVRMNLILRVVLAAAVLPAALWAETNATTRIGALEAVDHIGKTVTVTGRVEEVHVAEKVVRLNFDKPFPRQPFTAVVFSNRTNQFKDLPALKGSPVEVTGRITEYRDRPEIIMSRTNQLLVLPETKK
jgi:DNA/RNA endonuclease YhcR with UshA esterase domain